MTSETIEVVFKYTVEYETELGRAQAVRNALKGDYSSFGYIGGRFYGQCVLLSGDWTLIAVEKTDDQRSRQSAA